MQSNLFSTNTRYVGWIILNKIVDEIYNLKKLLWKGSSFKIFKLLKNLYIILNLLVCSAGQIQNNKSILENFKALKRQALHYKIKRPISYNFNLKWNPISMDS